MGKGLVRAGQGPPAVRGWAGARILVQANCCWCLLGLGEMVAGCRLARLLIGAWFKGRVFGTLTGRGCRE